jgi:hypothetical protein
MRDLRHADADSAESAGREKGIARQVPESEMRENNQSEKEKQTGRRKSDCSEAD